MSGTDQTGDQALDAGRGLRLSVAAATDVGRMRQQNEDSLYTGATSFAVADGMGGHQAGEVASGLALEPVADLDGRDFADDRAARSALVAAIDEANRTVVDRAASDSALRGMGTTLTVALVRHGRLHVGHVGDSRAYLLRGDQPLRQLTTDHTLVEQLVRDGRLTRAEAATHPQRSVITRAIGVDQDVEVDALAPLELVSGDQVLLCSDGLTGPVDDTRITDILRSTPDGQTACEALVDAANAAGGPDNITVVLLRVSGTRDDGFGAADELSDDGHDTQELAPVSTGRRVPINSREETGDDWARTMGRYGARPGAETPQGAPALAPSSGRGRRGRRAVVALLGIVALIAMLVGAGLFLLSRAYFVGEAEGVVALYQGLPQEVAGVGLHRLDTTSDIVVDELSNLRQRRLADGIPVDDRDDGLRLIERWRPPPPVETEPAAPPDATADPEQADDPVDAT